MDPRFVKGSPLPQGLGLLVDEYAFVRENRLAGQKAVDGVHDREKEIRAAMMSILMESPDITGASGLTHRVQLVQKPVLSVKDWTSLHTYIAQTGAFELLQRRLSETAARELLESGAVLPGVEPGSYYDLSITKR